MFLRERREYVHVGSRATSLLHSVPQKHTDVPTLKLNRFDGLYVP